MFAVVLRCVAVEDCAVAVELCGGEVEDRLIAVKYRASGVEFFLSEELLVVSERTDC